MAPKKSIYLLTCALLAVLGYGLWGQGPASVVPTAMAVALPKSLSTADSNQQLEPVAIAQANAALQVAQQQLAVADKPMPEEKPPLPNPTWQFASAENTPKPSLPLAEQIKVYSVVKIDHRPAQFPLEGEKLSLPMFNGRTLTANVETVTTLHNGDRVWTGHLDGYGEDFPVVMTYGDKLTFATIHTPEGSYALEAKEGVGWLYKNPSVAELSEPGYVDALEPH